AFGNGCVPLQVPIGSQDSFTGVVDVVHRQAYTGSARDARPSPVPAELEATVEQYRDMLMECAAESDDELIEKYLGGEPLTDEELTRGLIAGVKTGAAVPVLCASAGRNIGIQPLLDALIAYVPSPADREPAQGTNPQTGKPETRALSESEPMSALVFKTVSDPYVGKLTYFRVFSGVLKSDSHAFNTTRDHDERVGQLYVLRGKAQEAAAEIGA